MSVALLTFVLISGCNNDINNTSPIPLVHSLDMTKHSPNKPEITLDLLFIHHSCGATLFADQGEKKGDYCLFDMHPNGGGLRNILKQNNYNVHEATYGSKLGQDTDINHWHAKFRDHMELVLRTRIQDELLEGDDKNDIIVFKSCYPNNTIVADGSPPGDADLPNRTLWNCKAAYNSLLPIFQKYPDALFVAVTAPPTIKPWMNKYKEIFYNVLGRGSESIGMRARIFNNWLADVQTGWLAEYKLKNVVVFNFYDLMTGSGKSNWAQYPSKNKKDSHPSNEGNTIAADEFIDFINRAVKYSGLEKNE